MKKIGFAQRVQVQRISDPNSVKSGNPLRLEMQKMVNHNPLVIDRNCFKKTQEEREFLKSMKMLNKMNKNNILLLKD